MSGVQLSVKCVCVIVGGVHWRVQSLAGWWRLQAAPDDYSAQMLRLAATNASGIFMLKLFYFISDVVPC